MIEEKNLYKREKIYCHLRNGYFVTVNQFMAVELYLNV
jgi:hypothetical protein